MENWIERNQQRKERVSGWLDGSPNGVAPTRRTKRSTPVTDPFVGDGAERSQASLGNSFPFFLSSTLMGGRGHRIRISLLARTAQEISILLMSRRFHYPFLYFCFPFLISKSVKNWIGTMYVKHMLQPNGLVGTWFLDAGRWTDQTA